MDVVATPDVEMRAVKACVLIFFLDMASAMVLNSRQTARTTAHTMKVLETLQVPSALRCGRKGGGDGVGAGVGWSAQAANCVSLLAPCAAANEEACWATHRHCRLASDHRSGARSGATWPRRTGGRLSAWAPPCSRRTARTCAGSPRMLPGRPPALQRSPRRRSRPPSCRLRGRGPPPRSGRACGSRPGAPGRARSGSRRPRCTAPPTCRCSCGRTRRERSTCAPPAP